MVEERRGGREEGREERRGEDLDWRWSVPLSLRTSANDSLNTKMVEERREGRGEDLVWRWIFSLLEDEKSVDEERGRRGEERGGPCLDVEWIFSLLEDEDMVDEGRREGSCFGGDYRCSGTFIRTYDNLGWR